MRDDLISRDFSWGLATYCAKLSMHAYQNEDQFNDVMGKSWLDIKFFDFGSTQAYALNSKRNYILVFRGTEPTKWADIKADLKFRKVSSISTSGIKEGKVLNRPIIEFYLKNDKLNDPIINEEHIIVFEWATPNELEEIISLSSRINDFLTGYFFSLNIRLIDFKIEFGRYWDNEEVSIVVADEISPDNCRLWDVKTNKKLDKDRFRQDLGEVGKAYKEVAYRLGVLSENEFKKVIKNDL